MSFFIFIRETYAHPSSPIEFLSKLNLSIPIFKSLKFGHLPWLRYLQPTLPILLFAKLDSKYLTKWTINGSKSRILSTKYSSEGLFILSVFKSSPFNDPYYHLLFAQKNILYYWQSFCNFKKWTYYFLNKDYITQI